MLARRSDFAPGFFERRFTPASMEQLDEMHALTRDFACLAFCSELHAASIRRYASEVEAVDSLVGGDTPLIMLSVRTKPPLQTQSEARQLEAGLQLSRRQAAAAGIVSRNGPLGKMSEAKYGELLANQVTWARKRRSTVAAPPAPPSRFVTEEPMVVQLKGTSEPLYGLCCGFVSIHGGDLVRLGAELRGAAVLTLLENGCALALVYRREGDPAFTMSVTEGTPAWYGDVAHTERTQRYAARGAAGFELWPLEKLEPCLQGQVPSLSARRPSLLLLVRPSPDPPPSRRCIDSPLLQRTARR